MGTDLSNLAMMDIVLKDPIWMVLAAVTKTGEATGATTITGTEASTPAVGVPMVEIVVGTWAPLWAGTGDTMESLLTEAGATLTTAWVQQAETLVVADIAMIGAQQHHC